MECHFVLSARPISSLNPLLSLSSGRRQWHRNSREIFLPNGIKIHPSETSFSLQATVSLVCASAALSTPARRVAPPTLPSDGREARFAFRMIVSAPQEERPLFPTFPLSPATSSMRRGGVPTARSTLLPLRPDPINSTNRLLSIKSLNYLPRRLPANNLRLVMCHRSHNHDDVLHRRCKM